MESNSDRVAVGPSEAKGLGLFAKRDFKQGELVLDWNPKNKYISQQEVGALSENDKRYVAIVYGQYLLIAEPERYMNHSCNPNTETKSDGADYALHDIKAGEEITGDYERTGSLVGFSCRCGEAGCRKVVQGRSVNNGPSGAN